MKNQDHIPYAADEHDEHPGSNSAKFRRLMALLTRAKIKDDARHDLVYAWTNGRTASSRELTGNELSDLVWKFENHFDAPAVDLYLQAECKRLRAIVLKIATDCGIKEITDFAKFNKFMLEYSILKKELHRYTLNELHQLVVQFRGIETHYRNSAHTPGTKAWYHKNGMEVPCGN